MITFIITHLNHEQPLIDTVSALEDDLRGKIPGFDSASRLTVRPHWAQSVSVLLESVFKCPKHLQRPLHTIYTLLQLHLKKLLWDQIHHRLCTHTHTWSTYVQCSFTILYRKQEQI